MSGARAVLFFAAVLSLWNVWGYDLWAPDEPYFAEGAREMLVDGHWAVPHVNGEVTTDKPPLFFWLIALLSIPFGQVSSLTARLPSVLAGVGSVALTMRLARRLAPAGADPAARERQAVLAGLVLATTYLFWDKSRSAQIDALLCLLVLAALSAFAAFRSGEADGRRMGILFWMACALAVVAKGPVGFLVPLGVALTTLAVDRDLGAWRRFAPAAGPAVFLGLVGAWMALATLGSGGEYSVWGALREHVLERAASGMHHRQPPWYYLAALPPDLLPWTILIPGALLLAWRRRDAADRYLLAWASFVVLFFSIPAEKRDLYVLPACPAVALLVARFLVAGLAAPGGAPPPRQRWLTLPLVVTGVALVVTGGALAAAGQRIDEAARSPVLLLAATLSAVGLVTAAIAARHRFLRASLTLAAGTALLYLVAANALFPALDSRNSGRRFALLVREQTAASRAAGREVLSLGVGNLTDALSFYSEGIYFRRLSGAQELAGVLSGASETWVVADAERLTSLPNGMRSNLVEIGSARLSRRRIVLVRDGGRDGGPDGPRRPQ